ncbi:MAG: DNA cytosine methyltransferase [Methylococcales bacterium]|nr:DNA cytosine methyltransferase [Methylococcales bacterium]
MKTVRFGDVFAGAGGYSVGLRAAGLKESFAIEIDEWACETLANNLTCTVVNRDITKISDNEILALPEIDVLVGGPPCQGFSVAGPSQYGIDDPRNNLFLHFLRVAELKKPYICIIENVPQLFTKKLSFGVTALDIIRLKFEELGYCVESTLLDSSNYGVPQSRKRAFIVAYFEGIKFKFPSPTHTSELRQSSLFPDEHKNKITVWEAISDLPQIEASEGKDSLVSYEFEAQNQYQHEMREQSNGITNHVAMKHTKRLIERFSKIKPGQSLKDVPNENGQKVKYTGETSLKPYKSNNQRLDPNKVCLAIPASFQSTFLHPYKNRNLTAREAARLMSFPDSYIFKGKRTCMSWEKNLSQYNQIGNAICPLLAKELGKSCVKSLSDIDRSKFKYPTVVKRVTPVVNGNEESFEYQKQYALADISFFNKVGANLIELDPRNKYHEYKGVNIPLAYFPLALIIASSEECELCDSKKIPYASHKGSIPFLISKDGFDSLSKKGYDNGLDYHLRKFGSFPTQVAHYVSEILEESNFVNVNNKMTNERTGRPVRGFQIVEMPIEVEALRKKFNLMIKRKA